MVENVITTFEITFIMVKNLIQLAEEGHSLQWYTTVYQDNHYCEDDTITMVNHENISYHVRFGSGIP